MPDLPHHLSHLLVTGRAGDREFSGRGGGPTARPVADRQGHGKNRLGELKDSFGDVDHHRDLLDLEDLKADGSVICLEGHSPEYLLKLDSLEQRMPRGTGPKWLLLSVTPAQEDKPELATVWVNDRYRGAFLKLFEDYLERDSSGGKPKNNELVANIGRIRATVLGDLWQSDGEPPVGRRVWWEIWLRPGESGAVLLKRYARKRQIRVLERELHFPSRMVMWVEAEWTQLSDLPFTSVPIAEIRRPSFVDTVEDLSFDEQAEYVEEFASRLVPADSDAPAVCHLDSGVTRTHLLLRDSLAPTDLHTVIGTSGVDRSGHGTRMAGLALFGQNLEALLAERGETVLGHRLESVRILPVAGERPNDPMAYGDVTAQAASLPEITARRRRVFCMPVSNRSDTEVFPGQPTLWSVTVDALACGTDVVRSSNGVELLSKPRHDDSRLVLVSTGNVLGPYTKDHLDLSDTSPVEDPGQAWNAVTVGACTELQDVPKNPDYMGWSPVAEVGDLSPHSRTSLLFNPQHWPIKPDIVMEGGNWLHDGAGLFESSHPLLSLRTTGEGNDLAIASANATSAATAQAARLAAMVMAEYPEYWPETVRAILVHSAEWTPRMRQVIDEARRTGNLKQQQLMLRRYGWGVPNEDRVLHSSGQAVTLVVQDQFTPFTGPDFKVPILRLHSLPWPRDVLRDLGGTKVDLRVTLSYFIEPSPCRRGWRRKFSYASHGLRFLLQDPLETEEQFIQRVNQEARSEEKHRPSGSRVKWLIGEKQRTVGSLHQDVWETTGAELATTGLVAVHPVGGWWKHNKNSDRRDNPVRYSLVLSLRTPDTQADLYTPIRLQLTTPVAVPVL